MVNHGEESIFVFRIFLPDFTENLKADNNQAHLNKQMAGACGQPSFKGRNDWCPSGDCPKQTNPTMINPTHIVVHHSAGQTVSTDYAAVVRAYWNYHVNDRGWADIGYNWLVDPNGVLYEGRGDRVQGAHSPCMNSTSTGVCFIGDYMDALPSVAGLQMLKDFIAWDATDKNINVLTNSVVNGLGVMDHISGHKDGHDIYPSSNCTATSCPGTNLHNKLGTIKTEVAAMPCYIANVSTPSAPKAMGAISKNSTSVTLKFEPVTGATRYEIYQSTDNSNFSIIKDEASSYYEITGLTPGEVYYFKVKSKNSFGTSSESEVVAAMPNVNFAEILIVDGVSRSSFDAIKQYDLPMTALGKSFSNASAKAIIDGLVDMRSFKLVIWMLLDESSAQDTFNKEEQNKVKEFIDNQGIFIVSGSEIGWDLSNKGDAVDKEFYNNYLRAEYLNDAPGNIKDTYYTAKDTNGKKYTFDNGTNGIINVSWPDEIKAANGSATSFTFDGYSGAGVAGVSYQSGQGGLEYLSFPIEAVANDTERKDLLNYLFSKYSGSLAVGDLFIDENMRLFPNPTSGSIQIANPNAVRIKKVEIYNLNGQKFEVELQNNTIDAAGLVPGIYILRIENLDGRQGVFKFIKE
jgi:hypothetical protein